MTSAAALEMDSYVIDQIRCPECGLTCLQKNIYRHMTSKHSWTNDECKDLLTAIRNEKKNREAKTSYACPYCRALFRNVKHLMQHKQICISQPSIIRAEDDEMYMEEMMVGEEEGMKQYNSEEEDARKQSTSFELLVPPHRQNAARSVPAHHLLEDRNNKYKTTPIPLMPRVGPPVKYNPLSARNRGNHLVCPECRETADCLDDFIIHCKESHQTSDRKFIVEKKLFDNKDEFKKWFDQRQEDTCTSLTKRTGHGGETLYRCHRVGKYQSVAKSRKSNPRKIDQTCTAYLKVSTEEDGAVWVVGCFTHIGHDLDHKLLWLTETQENYVRELIDLGWTSDQIFFYIRNEYKDYECKLKYISKNDIRNITVRYNREKEKLGFHADTKPGESDMIDEEDIQETEEVPKREELVEEEEDDEIKAKIPRFESDFTVDHTVEIDDTVEGYREDKGVVKSDGQQPPMVVEEEVVVEEDEEYINVVDVDSMPDLEAPDNN